MEGSRMRYFYQILFNIVARMNRRAAKKQSKP